MRTTVIFLFLLVAAIAEAGQGALTGVVRDESGGVVSGASVILRNSTGIVRQAVTGPEGQFTIDAPGTAGLTLVVRAGGFAEATQPVTGPGSVDIVLKPASILDSVTVTPDRTEQRLADVPASVSIVDKQTIEQSPAVVSDDVLRLVPTFSLFRRTSSLSSHPTAQGVSLRGIGPSGVSRTLVLYDGIPFNDPFGGWVYWTRVPLDSVERIEVVDSPSSDTYGNYAMGGIINVVGTRPQPRTGELRLQMGNLSTPKGDFFVSDVWGKFGASVEGSYFDTDGFPVVVANERGPIDTNATVTYKNTNVKLDYTPSSRLSAFFRVGYFKENRNNGKSTTFGTNGQVVPPDQGTPEANDTLWKSVNGGVRASLPDQSDLQVRVFSDFETFHSNFLAVPNLATRAIARTTLLQEVPTTGIGTSAQWTKPLSTRHLLSAGFDVRHVDGESREQALDPQTGTNVTTLRRSGGKQISSGGYVQAQYWIRSNLSLTASGRVDHWRNYDAHNFETLANGTPTANNRTLPERADTVFSPRIAALYKATDRVSAWGSFGTGFRAPTLNELYRQFRVGTILTLANDQLGPERLKSGEIGVTLLPVDRLSVRSVWYDNRVKNPVGNVTVTGAAAVALSTACGAPGTTCQQRQNLGRTRIWGWQNDVDYRLGTDWRIGAGYLYNQAKVKEFAANPGLVGKFLPQVPEHRGSVHVAYTNPRIASLALNAMFFGRQYNEDTNTGTVPGESEPGLPAYAMFEFSASRAVTKNFDVFFGVQNLFDEEYYVGLGPTTIGTPRLINGGLRVRFSGK